MIDILKQNFKTIFLGTHILSHNGIVYRLLCNIILSAFYGHIWCEIHINIILLRDIILYLDLNVFNQFHTAEWGFPGGSVSEESVCSAGDLGFDPCIGEIPWRRNWQPTPVFLPGKSHGEMSLAANSMGLQELDTTGLLNLPTYLYCWIIRFPFSASLPPSFLSFLLSNYLFMYLHVCVSIILLLSH